MGLGLGRQKEEVVILPKWGGEDQESAFGLTRFEMLVRHPGDVVEAFGVQSEGQRYEVEM